MLHRSDYLELAKHPKTPPALTGGFFPLFEKEKTDHRASGRPRCVRQGVGVLLPAQELNAPEVPCGRGTAWAMLRGLFGLDHAWRPWGLNWFLVYDEVGCALQTPSLFKPVTTLLFEADLLSGPSCSQPADGWRRRALSGWPYWPGRYMVSARLRQGLAGGGPRLDSRCATAGLEAACRAPVAMLECRSGLFGFQPLWVLN